MSDTKVKLTEEQMIEILKNKKINQCSKEERDQVMDFAFGSDFMESDNKGEKVKITNKPEEVFTQSTIVYFDRYDFDLKGYGYRINGEFVEIHQSELPRLKEKLGDDVFNSAMQVGKDYGVDTIIFTKDDFEENANPWTLAYEKFCGESE